VIGVLQGKESRSHHGCQLLDVGQGKHHTAIVGLGNAIYHLIAIKPAARTARITRRGTPRGGGPVTTLAEFTLPRTAR